MVGLEPTTYRLRSDCSAIELHRRGTPSVRCGIRELNSCLLLGKQAYCHYTNPALISPSEFPVLPLPAREIYGDFSRLERLVKPGGGVQIGNIGRVHLARHEFFHIAVGYSAQRQFLFDKRLLRERQQDPAFQIKIGNFLTRQNFISRKTVKALEKIAPAQSLAVNAEHRRQRLAVNENRAYQDYSEPDFLRVFHRLNNLFKNSQNLFWETAAAWVEVGFFGSTMMMTSSPSPGIPSSSLA